MTKLSVYCLYTYLVVEHHAALCHGRLEDLPELREVEAAVVVDVVHAEQELDRRVSVLGRGGPFIDDIYIGRGYLKLRFSKELRRYTGLG